MPSNLVSMWGCRPAQERRVDELCSVAFSEFPFTILAAVFDAQWLGKPNWRKQAYEESRLLNRVNIVVESVEVEFITTDNVSEFQDLRSAIMAGDISQTDPLCPRLNGYGSVIQYDANT